MCANLRKTPEGFKWFASRALYIRRRSSCLYCTIERERICCRPVRPGCGQNKDRFKLMLSSYYWLIHRMRMSMENLGSRAVYMYSSTIAGLQPAHNNHHWQYIEANTIKKRRRIAKHISICVVYILHTCIVHIEIYTISKRVAGGERTMRIMETTILTVTQRK